MKCRLKKTTRLTSLCLLVLYVITVTRVYRWQLDTSLPTDVTITATAGRGLLSSTKQHYYALHGFANASKTAYRNVLTETAMKPQREKLQIKLNIIHATKSDMSVEKLWNMSDYLPAWMKNYFEWHSEMRQQLSLELWKSDKVKILVLQPMIETSIDDWLECLTAIPYLLRVAFETKRLFLMDWNDPMALNDFLVPPMGGIDWRTPKWLRSSCPKGTFVQSTESWRHDAISHDTQPLLCIQPSSEMVTAFLNSSLTGIEIPFQETFHDIWRILFMPSEPVRKNIEKALRSNGMTPSGYISIYTHGKAIKNSNLLETARDIMGCASQLRPGGPFFLLSENVNLEQAATALGVSESVEIYTSTMKNRSSKESKWEERRSYDYLRGFVHLYLMSIGQCIFSTESGQLSLLASMIGYNSSCFSVSTQKCQWNTNRDHQTSTGFTKHYLGSEMPEKGADCTAAAMSISDNDASRRLPEWMESYFAWHNHTKSNLNKENWNATKYLILGCFESHDHCGGISDRLKPLPMIVLEAYRHQRLVLIWWEKPKPLEEFLVPPQGGVDWIAPQWLRNNLQQEMGDRAIGSSTGNFDQGKALLMGGRNKIAIVFKIQTPSAGEDLFQEELQKKNEMSMETRSTLPTPHHGTTYKDVFHHLFRRFFCPVSRIQAILDQRMKTQNLIPGQYTAVHLRALYGRRSDRDIQEVVGLTVLGVNCASNISPNSPIYFASDSGTAIHAAKSYARMHSLPITVSDDALLLNNSSRLAANPIHLDKDPDWRTRDPSVYDSTFVDLYMMAQSRCVAYSNGGYGTFGSLLSYDADCSIRFFKGRHKIKRCVWMSENGTQHDLTVPNATEIVIGRL